MVSPACPLEIESPPITYLDLKLPTDVTNLFDQPQNTLGIFGEQFQDVLVVGHVVQFEVLPEVSVRGLGVAVRAGPEQHLEEVRVALLGGRVSRSPTRLHGVGRVGAPLQQPPRGLHLWLDHLWVSVGSFKLHSGREIHPTPART